MTAERPRGRHRDHTHTRRITPPPCNQSRQTSSADTDPIDDPASRVRPAVGYRTSRKTRRVIASNTPLHGRTTNPRSHKQTRVVLTHTHKLHHTYREHRRDRRSNRTLSHRHQRQRRPGRHGDDCFLFRFGPSARQRAQHVSNRLSIVKNVSLPYLSIQSFRRAVPSVRPSSRCAERHGWMKRRPQGSTPKPYTGVHHEL